MSMILPIEKGIDIATPDDIHSNIIATVGGQNSDVVDVPPRVRHSLAASLRRRVTSPFS